MIELTLMGHVPSKKNAWRRRVGGKAYLPSQMQADIDALVIQAQSSKHKLNLSILKDQRRLHISVVFILQQENEDLDNAFTTLCDVLEKAGVVENDKYFRSFSVAEIVDRRNTEQVLVTINPI